MKIRGELPCCRVKNAYHNGVYNRSSDGQTIRRFRCKTCNKSFSSATRSPLKWQKKRHINHALMVILSNRGSLSGAGQILKINPKTVAKKLPFLGKICRTSTSLSADRLPRCAASRSETYPLPPIPSQMPSALPHQRRSTGACYQQMHDRITAPDQAA